MIGGLGLGMAISKSLMDLHGGRITASSDGSGKGSTFAIVLPTVDAPATDTVATTATVAKSDGYRLRILLVEDHSDTANALRRLLANLGHSVTIGNTMAAAMERLKAMPFDLLLSDIGLPDGTGIDLIREVRRRYNIPAVAVSGFGMDADVDKCKEAGFDAHLTKPVNLKKLELIIREVTNDGKSRQH